MNKNVEAGKNEVLRRESMLTDDPLYRMLVESISDYAICMLDPRGIVVSWNNGAEKLTGFKPPNIIGRHYSLLSSNADKKMGKPQIELEKARLTGRYEEETWRVRSDGSKFWANIILTPIFSDDNTLVGFAEITRDLSERKKAENNLQSIYRTLDNKVQERNDRLVEINKDLRSEIEKRQKVDLAFFESERQFRTLADAIPQLAWMAEADGYIFWYNKRWFDYTGISPDHRDDWGWQSVVSPIDFPNLIKNWNDSISTGKPFEMELALKDVEGTYRWFLTRSTPVYDSKGNIVRWFGTSTDIQNQKEIEKRLEEALALRDEFLSVASHELKTPITSLKLQIDMARRCFSIDQPSLQKTPELRKTFDISLKQINRLIDLIENLLDVTRIQAGSLACNFEKINLKDLLQDVIERFSEQLTASKIELECQIPPPIIGHWDRLRLEQVFANLFSNAIKYAPNRPLKIKATRSGSGVRIHFKDNGPGIPAKLRPKLFDRFERAASTTRIAGLGLGLYITKQIVNAHGGDIKAESRVGKGTNFIINLPLKAVSPLGPNLQLKDIRGANILH